MRDRCVHGHAYTPENTRINTNGKRVCVECARLAQIRYRLSPTFPRTRSDAIKTATGEVLRCPKCYSTHKDYRVNISAYRCRKCESLYTELGICKGYEPRKEPPKGIPAGRIIVGRGLAGW